MRGWTMRVGSRRAMIETKWPEPIEDEPEDEMLRLWSFDGIAEATDGCRIEPDGICEHGYPSWLLYLELI